MAVSTSLTNHFLIAMPQLADPNFFHTVTYICEHNRDGAMGIVINRPLELTLGEVLDHMGIDAEHRDAIGQTVYMGGPVQQERGFVLHRPASHWDATLAIADDIGVTTSRDILSAIARGEGPNNALVALGYAGWGAGQLEGEIAENAWLSGPADEHILFETPDEQRWEAAAALLGVDLNLLSGDAGHA
ncbi:MAG: YqgE/AlgH family protein [Gammaproteobacteria bacterium]|nr:YqgE/AlgH family protein [Gammaproteobacteria bacterium]NIR28333.1 YqgE/AlgH family protein [Gammaproteobacteria bacterium]NIR96747.1 YqgE/AlgH family protein [Gammaproteobacteria bacterium]NIT62449.1 YqgE/AlgH family protein [Gammaproteobacteria bacterium]NIV19382.1 YqgE/AlgH family protein [Gammaproteobacteria bacterium]